GQHHPRGTGRGHGGGQRHQWLLDGRRRRGSVHLRRRHLLRAGRQPELIPRAHRTSFGTGGQPARDRAGPSRSSSDRSWSSSADRSWWWAVPWTWWWAVPSSSSWSSLPPPWGAWGPGS